MLSRAHRVETAVTAPTTTSSLTASVHRVETAVMAPTTMSSLTASTHRPLLREVPNQKHTTPATAMSRLPSAKHAAPTQPRYAATCSPESGSTSSLATQWRSNRPAMVPSSHATNKTPPRPSRVAYSTDASGLLSPTVKGSTGSIRAAVGPWANGVGMARATAVHPALARFTSPPSGVLRGVSTCSPSMASTAVLTPRDDAVAFSLLSQATPRRLDATDAHSIGALARRADVSHDERMRGEASRPAAPSLVNRSSPHGHVHRVKGSLPHEDVYSVGISHAPVSDARVAMANPIPGAKRARDDALLPRSLQETINVINHKAAQRTCACFVQSHLLSCIPLFPACAHSESKSD